MENENQGSTNSEVKPMLWLLWLLALPILGGWLFLFALCRVAARPMPVPSALLSADADLPRSTDLGLESPRDEAGDFAGPKRPRLAVRPFRIGLLAPTEAGYIGFGAQMRRSRLRRPRS